MKHNKLWLFTVSLFFIGASVFAHDKPQRSAKIPAPPSESVVDQANDEEKVRDLVAFFQLLLNTLGSSSSSARDKDIIITESYSKIFRDAKVQVEDDLAGTRSTITNKDVVAYLKDVDFFFENVSFELNIEDIKKGTNANGVVFYKVSLRRTIDGKTVTGETIKNTIPRFIEINFDPVAADLKIVSIYTNEFDEREALTNWWNSLSLEWKSIFRKRLSISDSVQLNHIKDMTALIELDLSENKYIQSIEPLGQLTNLRLLNLSGTSVEDLTPIRNLTELVELDLSSTRVFDLSPLRYASKLARLNISNTEVRSVAILERMTALQNLEMRNSHVFDFTPLSFLTELVNLDLKKTLISDLQPIQGLSKLMELNISRTNLQDISPLRSLSSLRSLNIDSTLVRDIKTLEALKDLEVLSANYTFITDLSPLKDLEKLQRVYCDQTPIKKAAADVFMSANPEVLVIYDSKDLQAWWSTLSSEWKRILTAAANVSATPSKEELARLPNLDSINFSNNRSVTSLEPLRRMQRLRIIMANNTGIDDLGPLQEHRDLRVLNISDTDVRDLTPLSKLTRLEVLRADRSKIESIEPIGGLKSLKELYVDRTAIHDITAREFLERNPSCLVVFKTIHIDRWWRNLDPAWKNVFLSVLKSDTTRENMHRLVEMEKFQFEDAAVKDLSALNEFVRLKELHFSGTAITEIPDIDALYSLKSLRATSSPLEKIGAIAALSQLEELDISNTPISDLRGLEGLQNLRSLNCAGTQIRKLDALRPLVDLQSLDCSNTGVSSLDPVMYLSLRSLKAYNTRISSKKIEQFSANNPDCNVVYYR